MRKCSVPSGDASCLPGSQIKAKLDERCIKQSPTMLQKHKHLMVIYSLQRCAAVFCVLWWGYKYCAVRWNLLISKLAAMQNNPSIFTLNYAPWTLMGLTPSKIVFRIGPLVDTLDFLLLHNLELLLNHETVLRLCLISLWLQKKGYHFFSTNFCILFF